MVNLIAYAILVFAGISFVVCSIGQRWFDDWS